MTSWQAIAQSDSTPNTYATRCATYERVAREPWGDYHFHREHECAARFAGVGNPLAMTQEPAVGPLQPGQVVLDHACDAGMDLLLAAGCVAPNGRAICVDMTPAMRECAMTAAEQAELEEVVEIRAGFFEQLPPNNASVDVVISNGVVNLSPDEGQVFREIHHALKPGGRLLLADVIVQRFNCFMGTSTENRVSKDLFVHAVNFYANKDG